MCVCVRVYIFYERRIYGLRIAGIREINTYIYIYIYLCVCVRIREMSEKGSRV